MRIIIASGRHGDVFLVHQSLSALNMRCAVSAVVHSCVDRCTPAADATLSTYRAVLRDSRADTVLVMPGASMATRCST